jgi:ATP-dependent RNA helicase DeaD
LSQNNPASPPRFEEMDLLPETLQSLERAGYTSPTPIQAALIPVALTGCDVLGQARTGTGKTASYLVPLLDDLELGVREPEPQCLILVPTRELADQVYAELNKIAAGWKLRSCVVCGGKPLNQQMTKLARGTDVVIGTPGRILDLLRRGALDLQYIDLVVLDEADRMLDIGFRPDIEKILRRCPKERQTLLLSATVPEEVLKLAKRYMIDPEVINTSEGEIGNAQIDQYYISVEGPDKYDTLLKLLDREQPTQAIVFCRTKRGTDKIALRLQKKYDRVAGIHGDLPQRTRDKVMSMFREGKLRMLVATDVLGRGIDVSGISHIINYDVPADCDDYVHRVGRTGRMGRAGVAYTFVSKEEGHQLTAIEMRINRMLEPVNFGPPVQEANGRPDRQDAPAASGEDSAPPSEEPPAKKSNKRSKYRRAL